MVWCRCDLTSRTKLIINNFELWIKTVRKNRPSNALYQVLWAVLVAILWDVTPMID